MIDVDALGLDNGDTAKRLLQPLHLLVLELAHDDANSLLGGVLGAFDVENKFVQTVLGNLAKLVTRVADTTKDEIRAAVAAAAEEGWGVDRLKERLLEMQEINSASRAMMIARTESGLGYNLGSLAAYEGGGITKVEVMDGDEDEPCKSANGQIWTLEQARANPLGHPNCTRAFAPVVE